MSSPRSDYSVSLAAGLKAYDAAALIAVERLEDLGLELHDEPPRTADGTYFDGRLPVNISSLGFGEIGEYYAMMVLFADFVEARVSLAKGALIVEDQKKDLAEAAVQKTKTGSIQERRDATIVDGRYVDVVADYLAARTYHELLVVVAAAARRDLSFLSRLVETKKAQMEQTRRGESLQGDRGDRGGGTRFRRGR